MKVLILGGTGMLGHKLYQVFVPVFNTWASTRISLQQCVYYSFFNSTKIVANADLSKFESVEYVVRTVQPQAVVNCVGVVKQSIDSKSPIEVNTLNVLLPRWLEKLSQDYDFKLIQMSTDCVFSGKSGLYDEQDKPDANDLYGITKLLGEVTGENCLTLRTSIIGRELRGTSGLLEWFLSQKGKTIQGYKRAIFSGFTTKVFAEILADILQNHRGLSGLYHISAEPISKHDLLCLIRDILKLDIEIEPSSSFVCDRSLNSDRLRTILNYHPPSWEEMITDLSETVNVYEEWRAQAWPLSL